MLSVCTLGPRTEAGLIRALAGERLEDLVTSAVRREFQLRGLLVFRGFDPDVLQFETFARQFSSRVGSNPHREVVPESQIVRRVARGSHSIGLHSENSDTPFPPDLVWFHCSRPASDGGETTFCDGIELWDALDTSTQQFFRTMRLMFRSIPPAESYQGLLDMLGSLDAVAKALKQGVGSHCYVDTNGRLVVEHLCSAVKRTRDGDKESFANGILARLVSSTYREVDPVLTEDGSPVPSAIIRELVEVSDQMVSCIDWEPGDMAMIDNVRYLHGRRGFTDSGRSMYTLISWL